MGFARRAIEQPGLGLYWYGLKLHKQEEDDDDDDEEEEEEGGNGGITAGKGRGSVRLRNAIWVGTRDLLRSAY